MQIAYAIRPRKVAVILAAIALYLALQSIIVEYVIETVDQEANWQVLLAIDIFSVNRELTIPTWFSATLLLIATVLFALIAAAKRTSQDRYTLYWIGLAAIFLYLTIDEGAAIHEIVADITQASLNPTGFLTFGWQIIAAPLVLIFGLLYLRFLFHLPPRIRNLFILAGILYVGGALVVEAVSANQWYLGGGVTLQYLAIGTVEEFCEMLGVVVLIYALLSYAVAMRYDFVFRSPLMFQNSPSSAVDDPASRPAQSGTGVSTSASHRMARAYSPPRPVMVLAIIVIGLNLVLLSWAWAQAPTSEQAAENPVVSAQAVIEQVVTDDVQVTRMIGRFGLDNLTSRQFAAALLNLFDEVMVVTAASMDSSIVLAGDVLPFDRNSLANTLTANGVSQFLIFDTAAVRVMVSNLEPETQEP